MRHAIVASSGVVASLFVGSAALAEAAAPASSAPRAAPYQFEIGPTVGYVSRRVASNADGISYDASLGEGFDFRLTHTPWLKTSARFVTESHPLALGYGALGTGASSLVPVAKVSILTLSGAVHPTYEFLPRLRGWLTIGIGWGKIEFPRITTNPGGVQTRTRSGVFLETPLGAGGSFDILPWLTVAIEGLGAPPFRQSGDMYQPSVEVGTNGAVRTLRAAPELSSSYYALVNLSVAL